MAGLFLATALAVALGCARTDWIDRTLVTENVSGVWFGGIEGRNTMQLELQHQGPQVTGFLKFLSSGMVAGGPPVPIVGSMAGDLFTFKDERGDLLRGIDRWWGRDEWSVLRRVRDQANLSPARKFALTAKSAAQVTR